jgi:hypothetical protein
MGKIIAYYSLTVIVGDYIKVKKDEIVYGYPEILKRKFKKLLS